MTALYARVTREESHKKGLSIPSQTYDLQEHAARQGWPTRLYVESQPIGGDTSIRLRPAGAKLVADIELGLVGRILVRHEDRLFRGVPVWEEIREICWEHEVEICTLAGPVRIDSPSDKFAAGVKACASQYELDQCGDRIRRVKRELCRQGRHPGGPPPFGYTSQARRKAELAATLPADEARTRAETELPLSGFLYIDEQEAEIVRIVYTMYVDEGLGCRQIAEHLNRLGYRRRSGKPWHPAKILRIIRDPAVAGFVAHDEAHFQKGRGKRTGKPDQVLYQGKHQAIITEEQWRKAQAIRMGNNPHLKDKQTGRRAKRFPLGGGALRCSVCGSPMIIKSSSAASQYAYYCCQKRKYYGTGALGCNGPLIRSSTIHAAFWPALNSLVINDAVIDRVHQEAERLLVERAARETGNPGQRLKKAKADLARWYKRHDDTDDPVAQEAAWARIVELTKQIKELEAATAKPQPIPRAISRQQVADHLHTLVDLVGQGGVDLVAGLVEHHGLQVQMLDTERFRISLDLAPPGSDGSVVVPLSCDARMRKDTITEWVEEQEAAGHRCEICGEPVKVQRRHYWRGVPKYHQACWPKRLGVERTRKEGFLNGQQAADALGVSRTQLGRLVKRGIIHPDPATTKKLLLFTPDEVARVARVLQ